MTKTYFSGKYERATKLLEQMYFNVLNFMTIEVCGGLQYFLTFTDNYSRFGYCTQRSTKFEFLKSEFEYQYGKVSKCFGLKKNLKVI